MGMTIEIDEQMIEREVKRQIATRLKEIDVNRMVEHTIRATKDLKGKYRNEYIYEILRKSTS